MDICLLSGHNRSLEIDVRTGCPPSKESTGKNMGKCRIFFQKPRAMVSHLPVGDPAVGYLGLAQLLVLRGIFWYFGPSERTLIDLKIDKHEPNSR
ncbi:MAG TPA: hypothetical protein VK957_04320 [Lunatimonas sp.]|nr:hypothetical protein [Lunatimonas sp.]